MSETEADRDSATRKKWIRVGQKASTTRIMAQAQESIDADELNYLSLRLYLAVLRANRDIILKMDTEILNNLLSEDDIVHEIEEADAYRKRVEMVITIEQVMFENEKQGSPSRTREVEHTAFKPLNQQPASVDRRSVSPPPTGNQVFTGFNQPCPNH